MHVKTYLGRRTQDILTQIKEELGPDAIILSNRSVRKDGERYYEVTAGVERHLPAPDTAPAAGASKSTAKAAYATARNDGDFDDFLLPGARAGSKSPQKRQGASLLGGHGNHGGQGSTTGLPNLPGLGSQGSHASAGRRKSDYNADSSIFDSPSVKELASQWVNDSHILDSEAGNSQNPVGWAQWHKEWSQIKDHLFALMKPSIQMERLSPRQRVALEYLQREGVSDMVVLELYRKLLASPGDSVLQSLSDIVPVQPWGDDIWPQRLHCFAGPYGAGKTTTALRMALQLRNQNPECRIAFINADCLRGNGRLVLRHWAELSDFAYVEAQDNVSMKKALVVHATADKIFVDLPSVSTENTLQELYARLGLRSDMAGSKATHCVLSPSYDGQQLVNFLKRYAPDSAGSIVWGKLDEAINFGSIVNVAASCRLPVSALSYGAELRDTLSVASPSLLWRLIFKRQLPSAVHTAPI